MTEYLDGRKEDPVHFLGAMVLDQNQTPTGHVEKRQAIDGQQRLTTLQIFLAAFRDYFADETDPVVVATKRRNSLVQTFGNLTLLTQGLNSAVSNSAWHVKKPALMQASLLPINLQLQSADVWDEVAIQNRSRDLFSRAAQLWPGP